MGEKSILAALAIASASPSSLTSSTETTDIATTPAHRAWVDSVTTAYAQHPDYAALAQLVLASQSESDLAQRVEWLNTRAAPTVGIPVLTMSAYPVASITGVLDRIRKTASQTATCEYKYDGARVQIHLSLRTDAEQHESAIVMGRIFSRNMEDNTEKYRSLLDVLARQLQRHSATAEPPSSPSPQPTRDVILEGEVVAIDRATQRFLPFQVLQTKTTTEFCLFAFDLLHLDGAKLLHRPLRERRALLRACFGEDPGYFEFVKSVDVDVSETSDSSSSDSGDAKDASETLRVRSFLQDAVAAGCEGLMVKALDGDSADYKAGVRSYSWMKVKQDYLTDDTAASSAAVGDSRSKRKAHASIDHGTFLPDTLDLVPVGAFYGKGRRAGVFGSFLLATYNAASCRFEVRALLRIKSERCVVCLCTDESCLHVSAHRRSARSGQASRTRSSQRSRLVCGSSKLFWLTTAQCQTPLSRVRSAVAAQTCGSIRARCGRSKPRSSRRRRRTRVRRAAQRQETLAALVVKTLQLAKQRLDQRDSRCAFRASCGSERTRSPSRRPTARKSVSSFANRLQVRTVREAARTRDWTKQTDQQTDTRQCTYTSIATFHTLARYAAHRSIYRRSRFTL